LGRRCGHHQNGFDGVGRLDEVEGFVVDLDGVVWIGDAPIEGAAAAIGLLRRRGKAVVFLTNDPRGSRGDYAERLEAAGIPATEEEIVTAAAATAAFMAVDGVTVGSDVFVIGAPALKEEVRRVGLRVVEGEEGRRAPAVVVGGHEAFDYHELRVAVQAVLAGARFYATGRDHVFPMPDGPWPATGAIVAAVETAAACQAIAVGKPEPFIFEMARDRLADCARVAIVGDNLASDIAGGKRAGLTTVLVLSGNATREDASTAEPAPDFVYPTLADLAAQLVGAGSAAT
jgi:phosphoglycolate/pyridoxal phosphate phosphatase family enzyme